jgi:hypothetical protein
VLTHISLLPFEFLFGVTSQVRDKLYRPIDIKFLAQEMAANWEPYVLQT